MNKVTIVTPPDDILQDGVRVLTYDLNSTQNDIVSQAIRDVQKDIIVYIAKATDTVQWTLDKKQKCSILILNAESENQTMVGYLAAQPNSYYLGNLKSLKDVNTRELTSIESIKQLMEEQTTYMKNYNRNRGNQNWKAQGEYQKKKFDREPRPQPQGLQVFVREGEDINKALRKLKKKMERANILQEIRERQFYQKPSEKRRKAKKAGIARWKKKQRENELSR